MLHPRAKEPGAGEGCAHGQVPAVLWPPWSSTPAAPGPDRHPPLTQMTSGMLMQMCCHSKAGSGEDMEAYHRPEGHPFHEHTCDSLRGSLVAFCQRWLRGSA